MATQARTISSWIVQGIPGAENVKLTNREQLMSKHPDTKKYPLRSFLDRITLPVEATDAEFTPGFFFRGYEGLDKLSQMQDKGLSYNQLASTGVGHFQGTALDIKHVVHWSDLSFRLGGIFRLARRAVGRWP